MVLRARLSACPSNVLDRLAGVSLVKIALDLFPCKLNGTFYLCLFSLLGQLNL